MESMAMPTMQQAGTGLHEWRHQAWRRPKRGVNTDMFGVVEHLVLETVPLFIGTCFDTRDFTHSHTFALSS